MQENYYFVLSNSTIDIRIVRKIYLLCWCYYWRNNWRK